jgi:hypothetical protein
MQRRIYAATLAGLGLLTPSTWADECTAVVASLEISTKTPHSAEFYQADAKGIPLNGKALIGRIIQTETTQYIEAHGKWGAQKTSIDDAYNALEERLKTDDMTCQKLGEETVNGRPTAKYSVHSERERTDNLVWISDEGYQLKSVLNHKGGQVVTEFDYDNVQPPDLKPTNEK